MGCHCLLETCFFPKFLGSFKFWLLVMNLGPVCEQRPSAYWGLRPLRQGLQQTIPLPETLLRVADPPEGAGLSPVQTRHATWKPQGPGPPASLPMPALCMSTGPNPGWGALATAAGLEARAVVEGSVFELQFSQNTPPGQFEGADVEMAFWRD